MPIFLWVAQTKKGKTLKGELEAADENIARSQLKRRNLTVTKIKPKPKDLFENVAFMQPKVGKKDIVIFTRQFSTMIDAGLPLVQGLNILDDRRVRAAGVLEVQDPFQSGEFGEASDLVRNAQAGRRIRPVRRRALSVGIQLLCTISLLPACQDVVAGILAVPEGERVARAGIGNGLKRIEKH